jgi:hypothetical protein
MKHQRRGPIGKTELNSMGCETPNCSHDHSVLVLNAGCHPGAGIEAAYHKKDGVVVLSCIRCAKDVGAFWVGEAPPETMN